MARRVRAEERIANRVRELREAAGMSQATLGRLVGTSRSQVANLERGERAATVSTLEAFARALDVRLIDLLGDEPALVEPRDRAHRIALKLRERGADYLDAVDSLITTLDQVAEAARGRR